MRPPRVQHLRNPHFMGRPAPRVLVPDTRNIFQDQNKLNRKPHHNRASIVRSRPI